MSGCGAAWTRASGRAKIEEIPLTLPEEARRTVVTGVRARKNDGQTEALIPDFLRVSGASLGGSKSLVDQSGENQPGATFHDSSEHGRTDGIDAAAFQGFVHLLPWRGAPCRRLAIHQPARCGESGPKLRMGAKEGRCALLQPMRLVMTKLSALLGEKSLSVVETEPQLA